MISSAALWRRSGSGRSIASVSGRSAITCLAAALSVASLCAWAPGAAAPGQAEPPGTAVAYRIEAPSPDDAPVRKRFLPDRIAILEALNRADAAHLDRLETIVVPEAWHDDPLRYSPFPSRYSWRAAEPRLLVVDQRVQAFAAYEHGALVRWGPVNSGREQLQTPAGLFHLNWRSRGRHSTVDPDWYMEWYFNFHNDRGLSFHQYSLPGRPASHACVRLLERDATWLYEWGETWTLDDRGWTVLDPGTPVLILGCYDFGAPPPWRSPEWLATGIPLPREPPTEVLQCRPSS